MVHNCVVKHSVPHSNGRPLVGFFGAYQSHVRNIAPLIEAIKSLPQFDFVIRGDGDLPCDVSDIKNLDIEFGRCPLSEIEELEARCDILLSLSGKSGITHPAGKTFYYASYPKPIIHIGDGVNKDFFREYLNGFDNRFVYCENNAGSIAESILRTVDSLLSFSLQIPKRMDAAVIARRIIEE